MVSRWPRHRETQAYVEIQELLSGRGFPMCLELQRRVRRAVACCSSDSSAFSPLDPSVSLQPVPCHPSPLSNLLLFLLALFLSLSLPLPPRTKAQMAGIDLNPERADRLEKLTPRILTYPPFAIYMHLS